MVMSWKIYDLLFFNVEITSQEPFGALIKTFLKYEVCKIRFGVQKGVIFVR